MLVSTVLSFVCILSVQINVYHRFTATKLHIFCQMPSSEWAERFTSYTIAHACVLAPCGFDVYSLVNKSQLVFAYNECTLTVAHSQLQPSARLPACTAPIYHSFTCDLPNTLDPMVHQSLTTPRSLGLMPSLAAPLSVGFSTTLWQSKPQVPEPRLQRELLIQFV